jgi:hypothetical protein
MPRFGGSILGVFLVAAGPFVLPARAQNASPDQRGVIQFASPRECVLVSRQSAKVCAQIAQHIWQLYVSQAPRFSSIETCWRAYNVCAPLPPDWLRAKGGADLLQARVMFAPPLAGVRLNPAHPFDELVILIDRGMKPMPVLSATIILPAGKFAPTPAMLVATYEKALRTEPEGAPKAGSTRTPGPEEGLQPEDIFPVPSNRRRSSRPIRERF